MYDLAVIGLGAMGSATLWQARRHGLRCVGIDRFAPPHDRGSSHGETRITRQAIGEGEAYVPLVLRSHEIWADIEAQTGRTLFTRCGFLLIEKPGACAVHGKSDFAQRTIDAARRFDIPHECLDGDAVASRFPQFTGLDGSERLYFEPGGGYLHPEECVRAQLDLAIAAGADILSGRRVEAVRPCAGGVEIRVDGESIVAAQAVLSAGAWMGELAGPALAPWLTVERQVLHWYPVRDQGVYRPGDSPVFIRLHSPGQLGQFYGFPPLPGTTEVKIAEEAAGGGVRPDQVDRRVSPEESEAMFLRHGDGRMAGIGPYATRASVCLYTTTPDGDFVIDRHPANDRIIIVSACSGHGFKHSAALGEAIAQMAVGGRDPRLDRFRLSRFQKGKADAEVRRP